MISGNPEMEENLSERLEMTFVTRTSPVTINVHLDGPMMPTTQDPYPYEIRTDEDGVEEDEDFSDDDELKSPTRAKSPRPKSPRPKSPIPKSPATIVAKTVLAGSSKDEPGLIKLPPTSPPLLARTNTSSSTSDPSLVQQLTAQDNGHWSGEFILDQEVIEKWKQSEEYKTCGHLYIKVHVEREGQPYDSFGTVEVLDEEGVSLVSVRFVENMRELTTR
jgi:hypothetical protein